MFKITYKQAKDTLESTFIKEHNKYWIDPKGNLIKIDVSHVIELPKTKYNFITEALNDGYIRLGQMGDDFVYITSYRYPTYSQFESLRQYIDQNKLYKKPVMAEIADKEINTENWFQFEERLEGKVASTKEARLVQKHNNKTDRQEWALVSTDGSRVLKWFGTSKPSEEAVKKREREVQYFKHSASLDDSLAAFGIGPKYVPTKRKTYKCPKCGGNSAYYEEEGADTNYNEIVFYCPDCKEIPYAV